MSSNKITRCFGSQDAKFGVHPSDQKEAKRLIKDMNNQGSKFEDLEKEILWHCYKHPVKHNFLQHVEDQVLKAKSMW